jgi:hypothetical protein
MAKLKGVTVRTPSPRDKQDLWRLLRAAGGRDGLCAWIDKYPPPKRGPPRKDYFDAWLATAPDAWANATKPPKGGYYRSIRMFVRGVWKTHEKNSQDERRSPEEREAWHPKHLGKSKEAVTKRLYGELLKRGLPRRR